jgi:hypothetical protein
MWRSTVHTSDRIVLQAGGLRRCYWVSDLLSEGWITVLIDGQQAQLKADKKAGEGQKAALYVEAPASVKIEVDRCPR